MTKVLSRLKIAADYKDYSLSEKINFLIENKDDLIKICEKHYNPIFNKFNSYLRDYKHSYESLVSQFFDVSSLDVTFRLNEGDFSNISFNIYKDKVTIDLQMSYNNLALEKTKDLLKDFNVASTIKEKDFANAYKNAKKDIDKFFNDNFNKS